MKTSFSACSPGFTLLELLVVMVIIGLLASYVGPRYFDQVGKSEVKTAENVKDPGGNLKRTLARSIDALGRVQQTTGRE